MGYFPLPELKGKPNRIFVDGKTLNQIAKESGIRLDTVQHRYSRADVWHNWLDRYVKKTICNECLKKYDVGGKQ